MSKTTKDETRPVVPVVRPRDWFAVAARFRKAGVMQDRRKKRLAERERRELQDEVRESKGGE